jgi:3-dehydroquinate dehydratase/shikimate dehydrogenase
VLGDPISQSLGHIFHNKIFHESANNAVYVKFKVSSSELSDFFKACDDLPFKGFSITMPLKTDVLRFVDKIDHDHKKIGGLNTIRKDGNQISGTNTDGMGALNAIEKKAKVKSKKMLILGAGGAARAIASEAKSRQVAQVAIINRTLKKSVEIAEEMDFLSYDFDSINRSNFGEVDFIINTIPGNIENTDQILKIITPLMTAKTIVMDINYNQPKSVLNKAAIAQGCLIIDGYEMFVQQALMQQEYWGF